MSGQHLFHGRLQDGSTSHSRKLVTGDFTTVVDHLSFPSFAFMISVLIDRRHKCGGTLINPSWVLTAAHCLTPSMRRLQLTEVAANLPNINHAEGAEFRDVDVAITHPSFLGMHPFDADIALLHLSSSINLPASAYVSLAQAGNAVEHVGNKAVVVGWGSTDSNCQTSSSILRQGGQTIGDTGPCVAINKFFNQSGKICGGIRNVSRGDAAGASCGDSGGPLLVQTSNGFVQVGVVSFGYGSGHGDVFTRVSAYASWITATIAESPVLSVLPIWLCYNDGTCCDDPSFLDRNLDGCISWTGFDCGLGQSRFGFSVVQQQQLMHSCPATCGLCPKCAHSNSSCCDNRSFVDEGYSYCHAWFGWNCSDAQARWGYSSQGVQTLLQSCPASCGLCEKEQMLRPSLAYPGKINRDEATGSIGDTIYMIACVAIIVGSLLGIVYLCKRRLQGICSCGDSKRTWEKFSESVGRSSTDDFTFPDTCASEDPTTLGQTFPS